MKIYISESPGIFFKNIVYRHPKIKGTNVILERYYHYYSIYHKCINSTVINRIPLMDVQEINDVPNTRKLDLKKKIFINHPVITPD